MNREHRRSAQRELASQNKRWPEHIVEVPSSEWPTPRPQWLAEVWRSRDYLLQIYADPTKPTRLTVSRTIIKGKSWEDNIPWDDLQRLKSECGYGDEIAVEVYPSNDNVVIEANMRHLWIMRPDQVPFVWKKR